jgi:hypothetical protein
MDNQFWIVILSIGFFVTMIGLFTAIGFLVYTALELRRVSLVFREFIRNTDDRIRPVLDETEQTLKSFRRVSDDVGVVTDNVRNFSGAMQDIVLNIRALSGIIGGLREGMSLRVFGVKAGLRAALDVLMKYMKERR